MLARAFLRFALSVSLVAGLSGCGRGVDSGSASRAGFEDYFQRFEAASEARGRSTRGDDALTIEFGKLSPNELGRCEWGFFSGRRVLIDPRKWERSDDAGREALFDHEVGHCLLKRNHDDNTFPRGVALTGARTGMEGRPVSVMYSKSLPGGIFTQFREYYLDELFGVAL